MANILVVDDSCLTHMLLDVMLRRLNHRILSAYHGRDALEILDKASVDLIISDVNMPHMDGLTLLEKLRRDQRYKNTPVIIITASGKEDLMAKATERGASTFLRQPFRSEEFSKIIGKYLEQPHTTLRAGM